MPLCNQTLHYLYIFFAFSIFIHQFYMRSISKEDAQKPIFYEEFQSEQVWWCYIPFMFLVVLRVGFCFYWCNFLWVVEILEKMEDFVIRSLWFVSWSKLIIMLGLLFLCLPLSLDSGLSL